MPRFRIAVNNAVQMDLCIECSPAVQEVPGSIPDWDASISDALCRGCRWPWSSPYIVVTPTWCNSHVVLRFEHPAPSHATEGLAPCSFSYYFRPPRVWSNISASESNSDSTPIKRLRHLGLGGSCSSTNRGSEYQYITPFEWLFA